MPDSLATQFRERFPHLVPTLQRQEVGTREMLGILASKDQSADIISGLRALQYIDLGLIRLVAHGDVSGFRSLIREGVQSDLTRIDRENKSKDRGQMYSSMLAFRSTARLLAIGDVQPALHLADLLNEDLAKRRTFVPWVKSMGLQFIHLVRDDREALEAVAAEAIKSRSKKLGSAKYYALLSHAIARRDFAAAAAAIPQVLIGHQLDCDPDGDVDFATSAAGQALCLYGLAMVNAAAMHGFRVPLNGDVQIPAELVVVPPELV